MRIKWSELFFFSSRRRHTRSYGDWSSDVCSSDLMRYQNPSIPDALRCLAQKDVDDLLRSEERRVGKECRLRWGVFDVKKMDESDERDQGARREEVRERGGCRTRYVV